MKTRIKGIGSYVVIKRLENDLSLGDDVLYGVVKYDSPKCKIDLSHNRVAYLKNDVSGKIIIDGQDYDVLLYYHIIVNFLCTEEYKPPRFPVVNEISHGYGGHGITMEL